MTTETIKLDGELLEKKKAWEAASQKLAEEDTRQKNLNARRDELMANLQGLEKAVPDCRSRKDKAFELKLSGQAGDGEVDRVKKALDLAESELSDCKEEIAAIDRIQKKEEHLLRELRDKELSKQRDFWRAVYENLKSKILDQVGDIVNQACVAQKLHGGGDRIYILSDIFGPDRMEQNVITKKKVMEEYLGIE